MTVEGDKQKVDESGEIKPQLIEKEETSHSMKLRKRIIKNHHQS